jgi:DNA transformation protein
LQREFIHELFAQFRPVAVKRMFGGAGIYAEGVMFALVFDGAIYLKVDAETIPDFAREGSQPFVYTRAKSRGRVGRALRSGSTMIPTSLQSGPIARWRSRSARSSRRGRGPKQRRRHQGSGRLEASDKDFSGEASRGHRASVATC